MGVAAFASGCGGGDSDSSPRLVAKSPGDNAVAHATTAVAVKFNVEVDPTTMLDRFVLTDASGQAVPATVTINRRQAALVPDGPLAGGPHDANISKGATDRQGHTLSGPTQWKFEVERLLVVTIDAEALPTRASQDHVRRLIYGDFGPEQRAGIIEMMNVAEKHGVELTFFLDVLEELLYPGQVKEVAQLIASRGHDVQLHTHPEVLPESVRASLGLPEKLSNRYSAAEATILFEQNQRIVSSWELPPFVAYRAGSFRYSAGIVEAMPAAGLQFSYNYNDRALSQQAHGLDPIQASIWDNDVIELPLSYIGGEVMKDGAFFEWTSAGTVAAKIGQFQGQWPGANPLVAIMHSWSLLYDMTDPSTGERHFEYRDRAKVEKFDPVLASLPRHVRVVTASELNAMTSRGDLRFASRIATASVFA
jgi:hypothetical protein